MSAAALSWTEDERADFIAAAKAAIKGPRAEDAACAPAAPLSPRRGGRLNAGMGLTSILAALSRVGWGPLRGREFAASRAVLDTLALLAHDTKSDLSAVIQTTARQLAKRAGYSLKHTSRCLQWLEDAGVIEWHRGGIRTGAPTPGVVKIIKRTLVNWVLSFRSASDAEDRARNAATRARLQFYRIRRNNQRPAALADSHVDMSSPLPSLQEEGASDAAPRSTCEEIISQPAPKTETPIMTKKYRPTYMRYMATYCDHGQPEPERCNACKYEAIMRQQSVMDAEKAAAARRRKEEEEEQTSSALAPWPPAFVDYMQSTYPDSHYRSWARLALSDSTAKELLHA
ncbi:hypothetical protein [uncultured Rothia sp.]|uniref:hypothetical protein n=1 Tax=uncultured Rothia sp. TaxID=316088 RepID=UPI0028DB08A9|nr:hypothetical protein [uncultured Rothia sp.]